MLQDIRLVDKPQEFYRNGTGFQFFQDQFSNFRGTTRHEKKLLGEISRMQESLFRKIAGWEECPLFYRRRLLSQLKSIDISRKEAFLKIDDIKRELRMLGFNLSLNPLWIRGLLKLIDEILDQTESHQRKKFSEECSILDRQLAELKNAYRLYQIEKDI